MVYLMGLCNGGGHLSAMKPNGDEKRKWIVLAGVVLP